jgi:hypothetical protein
VFPDFTMAESVFVQTVVANAKSQVKETRDGGAARNLARGYVRSGGGLTTVRDGIGWTLKWVARALYFSPVLAIAYAITGGHVAAMVVATFVGLVLTFFVVLILYVLAAFIAFGQSTRRGLARPHVSLEAETATETDTRDPGQMVTVRGRVIRLRGKGVVVSDAWQPQERTTYADIFGVEREQGLPVVVLPTTAPTLDAPTDDPDAATLALEKGLFGVVAVLREGDTVTLRGIILDRIANVNAFELDGEVLRFGGGETNEALPYREVQLDAGLLISDSKDEPLQIKVEKRAPELPPA